MSLIVRAVIVGIALSLLLSSSCVSTRDRAQGVAPTPFGEPTSAFQSTDPNQVTIAVVGINDFHGHLLPRERKLPNGGIVKTGGASALSAMINILKEEMHDRVLIVDAGDEWQGTIESNNVKGATVTEYFSRLGVKVAAIGNHEFDFSLENLQTLAKKARYNFLASNIYEKKNHQRVQWENIFPSKIVEVAGIKFGVIGVSTVSTPGTTRYEYVKHLNFINPVKPVKAEAAQLRKQGANAVLVTAHAGTFCKNAKGIEGQLNSWTTRLSSTPQGECSDNEITQLAQKTGSKILDGIVSGHTHQIVHHWFNGIPTVQDEAFNQFFNIIYFTFDKTSHQLIPSLTRIEGLVPICAQFFEGTNHCDVRRLSEVQNQKLVKAHFHGHEVHPDAAIDEWLKPLEESTEKYRKQIIATSGLPLSHYRDREEPFSNLVADAIRLKAGADFALINSGGIRASLDAGPITYDDIFRALPFDNLLNVIKLKGKDVKLLYQIATAGNHGLVGAAGLKLTIVKLSEPGKKMDLNHDGKLEAWEENRLKDITLSDGTPLKDNQWYTVATFDFLVNGGDDLHWFMGRIPKKNIDQSSHEICRDIVIEYLRSHQEFNTKDHPLVDTQHPRIVLVDSL